MQFKEKPHNGRKPIRLVWKEPKKIFCAHISFNLRADTKPEIMCIRKCVPEIFDIICCHCRIGDPIIYNSIYCHRYWVTRQHLSIIYQLMKNVLPMLHPHNWVKNIIILFYKNSFKLPLVVAHRMKRFWGQLFGTYLCKVLWKKFLDLLHLLFEDVQDGKSRTVHILEQPRK